MVPSRLPAPAASAPCGTANSGWLQADANGVRDFAIKTHNLYVLHRNNAPKHPCSFRAARRLLLPFIRRAVVGSQVIAFFSLTTAAERLQRHWHAHVTRCVLRRRRAELRRAAALAAAARMEEQEVVVVSRELGLHMGAVASLLQAVWRGHVTRAYIKSIKQRKVMCVI